MVLHDKLMDHHKPGPQASYPWDYWPAEESRSECGYVGLTNLGATCYMASCMQHLYMMPQARAALLAADPSASRHATTLHEMQRMFAYLMESERKAYNPRSFCKVYQMDHQPLNTGEQKDMAEFFIDLVSKLEEMTPELKKLVKTLFCGVLSNNVVSLDCPHVSRTLEEFYTVRCQVADMRNLHQSLDEVTVKDTLEGDNCYTCSQCAAKVRAEKRACFKKLPRILCFNTMRYTFNMLTMLKEKVNTHFSFPMRLDMSGYVEKHLMPAQYQEEKRKSVELKKEGDSSPNVECEEPSEFEEHYEYELIGVTVHTGTADGGHYYSFIRDREHEHHDRWLLFNDAEVKPFDPAHIAAECFGGEMTSKTYDSVTDKFMDFSFEKTNSAYMLFYELSPPRAQRGSDCGPQEEAQSSTAEESSLASSTDRRNSDQPAVTLPPDLLKWIWDDNMQFLHDKNIFQHAYFTFMGQMCSSVPQSLLTLRPEITEVAARLSTSFFIETFIHAKEKMENGARSHLRHLTEYFSLLYEFSKMGEEEGKFMLRVNAISSMVSFYLGQNSATAESPTEEASGSGSATVETAGDKLRPGALDKMVALVGGLVERSRDAAGQLTLQESDAKALLNAKGFPFIYQQTRDSLNLQQTRSLIFALCRWNEPIAQKIVNVIFQAIAKHSDVTANAAGGGQRQRKAAPPGGCRASRSWCWRGCGTWPTSARTPRWSGWRCRYAGHLHACGVLVEGSGSGGGATGGLPCFTQLVLARLWDVADLCPHAALEWLALQVRWPPACMWSVGGGQRQRRRRHRGAAVLHAAGAGAAVGRGRPLPARRAGVAGAAGTLATCMHVECWWRAAAAEAAPPGGLPCFTQLVLARLWDVADLCPHAALEWLALQVRWPPACMWSVGGGQRQRRRRHRGAAVLHAAGAGAAVGRGRPLPARRAGVAGAAGTLATCMHVECWWRAAAAEAAPPGGCRASRSWCWRGCGTWPTSARTPRWSGWRCRYAGHLHACGVLVEGSGSGGGATGGLPCFTQLVLARLWDVADLCPHAALEWLALQVRWPPACMWSVGGGQRQRRRRHRGAAVLHAAGAGAAVGRGRPLPARRAGVAGAAGTLATCMHVECWWRAAAAEAAPPGGCRASRSWCWRGCGTWPTSARTPRWSGWRCRYAGHLHACGVLVEGSGSGGGATGGLPCFTQLVLARLWDVADLCPHAALEWLALQVRWPPACMWSVGGGQRQRRRRHRGAAVLHAAGAGAAVGRGRPLPARRAGVAGAAGTLATCMHVECWWRAAAAEAAPPGGCRASRSWCWRGCGTWPTSARTPRWSGWRCRYAGHLHACGVLVEGSGSGGGATGGLPCFTQLVLARLWDVADLCPHAALEWLALQVPRNKAAHAWALRTADRWVEQQLLAAGAARVRAAAALLLVALVPSQHFRAGYARRPPPAAPPAAPPAPAPAAPAAAPAAPAAPAKLPDTAHHALHQFGQYFNDLWDLYHPGISEPSIAVHPNKQALLTFWHTVSVDCPENVQLAVSNPRLLKHIAFNYILADHEDGEVVAYNRAMLPPYYALLRLCCRRSGSFARALAQHQNIHWAFRNIAPHAHLYPGAADELLRVREVNISAACYCLVASTAAAAAAAAAAPAAARARTCARPPPSAAVRWPPTYRVREVNISAACYCLVASHSSSSSSSGSSASGGEGADVREAAAFRRSTLAAYLQGEGGEYIRRLLLSCSIHSSSSSSSGSSASGGEGADVREAAAFRRSTLAAYLQGEGGEYIRRLLLSCSIHSSSSSSSGSSASGGEGADVREAAAFRRSTLAAYLQGEGGEYIRRLLLSCSIHSSSSSSSGSSASGGEGADVREAAAFRRSTLAAYLQGEGGLNGRTCWTTLISAFCTLVENEDDRLYVVYNGGLQITFESLHAMYTEGGGGGGGSGASVRGELCGALRWAGALCRTLRTRRDAKEARALLLACKDWPECARRLVAMLPHHHRFDHLRAPALRVLRELVLIGGGAALGALVPLAAAARAPGAAEQRRAHHHLHACPARPAHPAHTARAPHHHPHAAGAAHRPYHRFIDVCCRVARSQRCMSEQLVLLSALCALEAVPLRFSYFAAFWRDVAASPADAKLEEMLLECSVVSEYMDAVLLDERESLEDPAIYQFMLHYYPKMGGGGWGAAEALAEEVRASAGAGPGGARAAAGAARALALMAARRPPPPPPVARAMRAAALAVQRAGTYTHTRGAGAGAHGRAPPAAAAARGARHEGRRAGSAARRYVHTHTRRGRWRSWPRAARRRRRPWRAP
ncbi:hypothetical protein ACJJTC_009240 [Scirpophaga incertulas]